MTQAMHANDERLIARRLDAQERWRLSRDDYDASVEHCSRCGVRSLNNFRTRATSNVEYGDVIGPRRLCAACGLEWSLVDRRKAAIDRRRLLPGFVSYTSCAAGCVGCRGTDTEQQRDAASAAGAAATRVAAAQRDVEQAELARKALNVSTDATPASPAPHCHFCGQQGDDWRGFRARDDGCLYCNRCYHILDHPDRRRMYDCPVDCTGCKAASRVSMRATAFDNAKKRAEAARQELGVLAGAATPESSRSHCWFCGSLAKRRVQSGGRWWCVVCNAARAKNDSKFINNDSAYKCPPSCTGCRAE